MEPQEEHNDFERRSKDSGTQFREVLTLSIGDDGSLSPTRQQEAWLQFQRVLDDELVGPLVDDAMSAADPGERAIRSCHAQLVRAFHIHAVSVLTRFCRRTTQLGLDRIEGVPPHDLQSMLALSDRILRSYERPAPGGRQ